MAKYSYKTGFMGGVRNFGRRVIIPYSMLASALGFYACGGDDVTGGVVDDGDGNGNVILPGKNYNVAGTVASFEKVGDQNIYRFKHPKSGEIVEVRMPDLAFENVSGYRNPADFDDNGQVGETDIPRAGSLDDLVVLQNNWGAVENKSPNGAVQNGYRNVGDVYVEVPQEMLDNADKYTVRVGTKELNFAKANLVDGKFAYVPTGAKEGTLEVMVTADDKNGHKMTYVTEVDKANLPTVYASGEVVDKKIMDINIPKNGDRVYLLVDMDDVENAGYSTLINGKEIGRNAVNHFLLKENGRILTGVDITSQIVEGMNKIGIAEESSRGRLHTYRITNSEEFDRI